MVPRSAGLQKLPPWDLGSSHSQLYEQLEQTKVMLVTYESYLSDLLTEYAKKPSKRKGQAIEAAASDVRAAYSQYVAIGSCFRQKSKDTELRKEVKEALEKAQQEHALLQEKADEVLEGMQEEVAVQGGGGEERNRQVKPVKELEPSIVAHFKLSGVELEKWSNEMAIWGLASGFQRCAKEVQVAFASKFVEQEMTEKIKEEAELEGIDLDFKSFVEQVKVLCQSQSYLFVRRVEFFLMRNKDTSAKGFVEYMHKILKEYKTAEISAMASDGKTYSVYKALSEMPATLRNRVVQTMEREMSFEELRSELEKVASLKTMEDAVGKPKLTKLAGGQGGDRLRGGSQAQGERGGGGGGNPRRGTWPEGFDPSKFGCLRCGERTDPPHEARNCSLQRKDLICSYCGMKQSHVEAVCFKKLEAEGKLVSKQPERSNSPAGGRPVTPGPAKTNKMVRTVRREGQSSRVVPEPRLNKIKLTGGGAVRSRIEHVVRGEEAGGALRLCTVRTGQAADGLPRRTISLWNGSRGARIGPPSAQVSSLCDSGSNAAVINKDTFDKVGGEIKVFSHGTVKLASTSGEELPILGAVDVWIKLDENDRYKRKVEALIVDGIDEELILGVNELKLVGLLDQAWPMVEVAQEREVKLYSLKQADLTLEERLQEKVDMMEDSEEEYPEGEAEEVAEGVWEVCQDEHTVEDIPGLGSMPERVQRVLRAYREVFSNRLRKELNWPEQEIELMPGLPELPKQATRARRVPARYFENAWRQLQALQHQNIIAKLEGLPPPDAVVCSAFWTQKSGAPPDVGRMVCDSRPLNCIIRRGHHPAYDPASLIRGMHPGIRCYWKCDLAQAFYQCKISEASSKKYLNFLTEFGYFRFLRSPMGVSTSSSTLGQALDAKTGHLVATKRLVREADDYLGGGETEGDACDMLEQFLEVCEKEGITLSPKKFEWGGLDQPIQWAGLVVQSGGARPDEKRIEAVKLFPQPDNVKSLRSWIALINQLGYHVEGLSAKTALQRELLKKNVAWNWTDAHTREFLAVREEVGNPNTLWHYDGTMDLGLAIDTQRTNGPNSQAVAGLGFVCFNYHRDPEKAEATGLGGPLHPRFNRIRALQYGSVAAKESWRSKAPVIVEGIGALAALYRLPYFCRGQAVIDVFLDSKTLVEAWCNKGLEDMAPGLQDLMIELARWPLRMHYCDKKRHVIPDALGRNCVEGEEAYDPRLEAVEGLVEYPRLVGTVPSSEEGSLDVVRLGKMVQEIQQGMEENMQDSWEDREEEVEDKQEQALALAMAGAFTAAQEDEPYRKVCEWVALGKTKAEVVRAGKGNPVHQFKQWWEELSVVEEPGEPGRRVMMYGGNRLVVPKPMVASLVDLAHQPHKGEQITLAFLKRYYLWQGMNNQVRQKCRECLACTTYTKSRPKEPEVAMSRKPPRPWFSVGMDFFSYEGDHVMVVVDYLTAFIVTHTFRATPSARQTVDALDDICRQNGGYFSILATDGGPQMDSEVFRQWVRDKFIIHRMSSATAAWSNGRSEKAVFDLRQMWDRGQKEKGARLTKGERAEALAVLNDSPRRVGGASPARLHFRRQYRHPKAPAMDLVVCEEEEEGVEWQSKTDRKLAANRRTATNQKKPLKLRVGLRVLVEDKEGANTLPGEIVGVRSQRSCWVRMEGSGRTLLRNRKFLERDPSFQTDTPQVLTLKCMKARACQVMKGLVGCQQSGTKEGLGKQVDEGVEILDRALVGVESLERRAAELAQHLLRVLSARPAVAREGSSAPASQPVIPKKVTFSDHVSFMGMEREQAPGLATSLKTFEQQQWVAGPGQVRTVLRLQQQQGGTGQQEAVRAVSSDSGLKKEDNRQVVFLQAGLSAAEEEEQGEAADAELGEEDARQVVFRQEGQQQEVRAAAGGSSTRGLPPRAAVEVWLDTFKGPPPSSAVVELVRRVELNKREGDHARRCQSCAGLSSAVPIFVRRCKLTTVEERELFVAWSDFASVPGREFIVYFQEALDVLSTGQRQQ